MHTCTAHAPQSVWNGGLGGQMSLEHNPTSPNDLHLFSLYRHVLSCAFVSVTSVRSAVSVSLCAYE